MNTVSHAIINHCLHVSIMGMSLAAKSNSLSSTLSQMEILPLQKPQHSCKSQHRSHGETFKLYPNPLQCIILCSIDFTTFKPVLSQEETINKVQDVLGLRTKCNYALFNVDTTIQNPVTQKFEKNVSRWSGAIPTQ